MQGRFLPALRRSERHALWPLGAGGTAFRWNFSRTQNTQPPPDIYVHRWTPTVGFGPFDPGPAEVARRIASAPPCRAPKATNGSERGHPEVNEMASLRSCSATFLLTAAACLLNAAVCFGQPRKPQPGGGSPLPVAQNAARAAGSVLRGLGHRVSAPSGVAPVASGDRVVLPPGITLNFGLGAMPP